MKLTAMGLDLRAICGHALLAITPGRGTVSVTGTWDCRGDGASVDLEAFERCLRQSLGGGVDKVFYVRSRDHRIAMTDRMMQVCAEKGVACDALTSHEVKRFAMGNGSAKKARMIEIARIWGFGDAAANEAEAILVARCGVETRIP